MEPVNTKPNRDYLDLVEREARIEAWQALVELIDEMRKLAADIRHHLDDAIVEERRGK